MITSTKNERVKQVARLTKTARARREEGLFAVEGEKLFSELPEDWRRDVYVTEGFLGEPGAEALLGGAEYEVVAEHVMRAMSDAKTPQGILCVARMPRYGLDELLPEGDALLLVLEGIQDPGNLGTMLRAGEGAGITGIIADGATVDFFHPRTVRATMGSIFRVPFYVSGDLPGTVREIKARGVRVYAALPHAGQRYDAPDYAEAAFLIGNEGNGLSEGLAALADEAVRIPMRGRVESLNAAVCASLLLFEAAKRRWK